jgi:ATPase subunit of ABC transporter with duplicated ATPase domains
MSSQYVYTMHQVAKRHPPDKTVFENLTLSFFPGAKIGVLGYNGAGKSSLLRIMAGRDEDYRGEALLGTNRTVGFLEQEPELDESKTVKGNVEDGVAETKALLDRFNELSMNYSDETADEFAQLQEQIDAADAWNLDTQLEYAMDALRLPPADAEVTTLSGGERRRVALCRLLLRQPDLLLLDEPTNHLDAESVAWLERYLAEYEGAVVAVTHDRYFLDNVAGWILELDRGKGIPYEGNYSAGSRRRPSACRCRSARTRRASACSPPSSSGSHEPEGPPDEVEGPPRPLRGDGQRRADRPPRPGPDPHPAGPRLGSTVIKADGLRKGFGDRLLIEDLTFDLPRAGIVGIIGANGAGKTTLFKMITGQEQPDGGSIEVGDSVQLAYVDQSRDALNPDKTVWEEISEGYDQIKVGDKEMNSRQYVGGFNFKKSDQQKRVGTLSGGERNRVHLAKLLKSGGNVLLLDEPTNDLDVDTLRALEQALLDFAGCAVVISHDRWFLDRCARTCSRSRATRRSRGSRGTSRPTRRTATSASGPRPTGRTGSPTRSSSGRSHPYGANVRRDWTWPYHSPVPTPTSSSRGPRPASARPSRACSPSAGTA